MRLSLCIATYNEEKNIHIALDSAIEWVDEVVVVDGGSTDKTLDILKSYGDKVRIIHADNPPMFHINKQKAIEAAQGDWILQLDADEEVTRELRHEIEKILNNIQDKREISPPASAMLKALRAGPPPTLRSGSPRLENINRSGLRGTPRDDVGDVFAYQIPRRNFFLGRPLMKGGVYPDYTIRLYKKGAMYFPCKDVHENVMLVGRLPEPVEGSHEWLGTLGNPMNHYSDPDFGRYLARWQRYTSAEAVRVVDEARKEYGKDKKKLLEWKILFLLKAFFLLPPYWFAKTYIRHKGFQDGWQGFVFHFMSAVRWWGIGGRVVMRA